MITIFKCTTSHVLLNGFHPGIFLFWFAVTISSPLSSSHVYSTEFPDSPPSLFFMASDRLCRFQPVSTQRWYKQVFINQVILARPFVGVDERNLSLSLYFSSSDRHILLILLRWFVRWEVRGRFVRCCFPDSFKIVHMIFVLFPSSFSSCVPLASS